MRTTLRGALHCVLDEYPDAKSKPFTGHPLATFIRDELPASIAALVSPFPGWFAQGSPGQGNWADGPWVAVFDPIVTDTAQEGYYPVCLFSGDMQTVTLSLNQGVTALKKGGG